MGAGRPTKYTKEMPKKVLAYLNSCVDGWDEERKRPKVNLPTVGGVCMVLGVAESTVHKWAKEHPEFSESLRILVKEQEKRLLDSGLSGDYNPTIAKLVLSSNHGMSEKQEVKHDGNITVSLGKLIKDANKYADQEKDNKEE